MSTLWSSAYLVFVVVGSSVFFGAMLEIALHIVLSPGYLRKAARGALPICVSADTLRTRLFDHPRIHVRPDSPLRFRRSFLPDGRLRILTAAWVEPRTESTAVIWYVSYPLCFFLYLFLMASFVLGFWLQTPCFLPFTTAFSFGLTWVFYRYLRTLSRDWLITELAELAVYVDSVD